MGTRGICKNLDSNKNEKFSSNFSDADGRDNFIPDKLFIEICKDIGKSPNYQYQLLKVILQVQEKVMEAADKKGLSTTKKIMLTHSKLRQYPNLRREIIQEILVKKRLMIIV